MTAAPGYRAYELACDHDRAGREASAVPLYEEALRLGLDARDRREALVGLGSSLRNVRRSTDAVAALRLALGEFPSDAAATAFLGLA